MEGGRCTNLEKRTLRKYDGWSVSAILARAFAATFGALVYFCSEFTFWVRCAPMWRLSPFALSCPAYSLVKASSLAKISVVDHDVVITIVIDNSNNKNDKTTRTS